MQNQTARENYTSKLCEFALGSCNLVSTDLYLTRWFELSIIKPQVAQAHKAYMYRIEKKRSPVHDRATRNNNKLQIPLYRTFRGKRTFAYRAVSLWNSLDEGLQSSTSVKALKCSLKTSMLNERGNL